ncbi:hypothetical protein BpHYR1_042871 [Brachionus plicatilis]|uniref:Uncharacterized protein n=1 Tax=Brachionus plicatilis TaxID=10195 RepID=A0A3M7SEV6_BRAPC|nr:hypothetical protein BpHYR1_042871 [Brachionus plicatilis]
MTFSIIDLDFFVFVLTCNRNCTLNCIVKIKSGKIINSRTEGLEITKEKCFSNERINSALKLKLVPRYQNIIIISSLRKT